MRKLFIGALALLAVACQTKEEQFKVTLKIEDAVDQVFVLGKIENRNFVGLDTAQLVNGVYEFTGKVDYPQFLSIAVEGKRPALRFYGENSQIQINGHIDSLANAEIIGSATQDLWKSYEHSMEEFKVREEKLYEDYRSASQSKDQEAIDQLMEVYNTLTKEKNEKTGQFISANSTSPVAVDLVKQNFFMSEYAELEEQFNKLDTALTVLPAYTEIHDRLVILEKVQIGKEAPDFTLTSIDGQEVSLKSLRGNYLLIDFWASWCGPCRQENPNVKAAYNKFHKQGFDVLSVSVDRDENAWRKAVEEDEMIWTQLHDSKKISGEVYGVMGIPHTLLLDKDGIIIAKNIRGHEIHKKLEEVLL